MTKEKAKALIGEIIDDIDDAREDVPSVTLDPKEDVENGTTEPSSFTCGDLKMPPNMNELPSLSIGTQGFTAPKSIDMRDYVTRIINQGSFPTCACCSSALLSETLMWRKSDVIPRKFDQNEVYRWCKQRDGIDGDGTDLVTSLSYFIENGYFDKSKCRVQVIRAGSNAKELVKFCIHRFGIVQLGFNVTREWQLCNANKTSVTGNKPEHRIPIGGHSVISLGYDRNGIYITNSWGENWGSGGEILLTWDEFDREFLYGAMISNCLDGLSVRT